MISISRFLIGSALAMALVLPGVSMAAVTLSVTGNGALSDFVDNVLIVYINYAIYLITAATVLYTVIGAFHMIGSEEKREDGKTAVYYGIIALFVMTSIWGLVNILDSTFGLSGKTPITPRPIEQTGTYRPGF